MPDFLSHNANAILTAMKAYILYNKGSSHERLAEDFAGRLEREQVEVELVDADSERGSWMAETYDIMGRPAVLLVREDGSPMQVWQGVDGLPLVTEVAYLAHS